MVGFDRIQRNRNPLKVFKIGDLKNENQILEHVDPFKVIRSSAIAKHILRYHLILTQPGYILMTGRSSIASYLVYFWIEIYRVSCKRTYHFYGTQRLEEFHLWESDLSRFQFFFLRVLSRFFLMIPNVLGIAEVGVFENRQFKYSTKADRSTSVDILMSAPFWQYLVSRSLFSSYKFMPILLLIAL